MAEKCTCCAVHGAGVHRQSLTPPPRPEVPASAAVRAAERDLAQASASQDKAWATWSQLDTERHNLEIELQKKYSASIEVLGGGAGFAAPGSLKLAAPEERARLEYLTKQTENAFQAYELAGAVVVEKRQAHARAAHRETQQVIASWAEGA